MSDICGFAVELISAMLADEGLGLQEQDVKFYQKGCVAGGDENLERLIRWHNAKYANDGEAPGLLNNVLLVDIREGEKAVTLNLVLDDLYESALEKGLDCALGAIRAGIAKGRGLLKAPIPNLNEDLSLEELRDRLIVRPINYDKNQAVLEQSVYRRIGDIALTLYVDFTTGGDAIQTAKVTREQVERWGEDGQAMLDWALENTARRQPPMFLTDMLGACRPVFDECGDLRFYGMVPMGLTTRQYRNGAVAAFLPGVLRRVRELVGADYYLAFTSTDQVYIHPVDSLVSLESIRTILDETNRTDYADGEMLTGLVYRYWGDRDELAVVPDGEEPG